MVKWFVRSHAENTNRAGKYLVNTMFAMEKVPKVERNIGLEI